MKSKSFNWEEVSKTQVIVEVKHLCDLDGINYSIYCDEFAFILNVSSPDGISLYGSCPDFLCFYSLEDAKDFVEKNHLKFVEENKRYKQFLCDL